MKKVPVYFYYLDTILSRLRNDEREYDIRDFIKTFSQFLEELSNEDLNRRKYDFSLDEKVLWLDSYSIIGLGCYDLVFKSAKYNHVRNVIDTDSMTERGIIKNRSDGDEEKTHFCIRYVEGQSRFICVHESNYYGISISRIMFYLNDKLSAYQVAHEETVRWNLESEIMPCNDFLEELRKMKSISLLTVTIERSDFQNDFMRFADRDSIKDTVDILIRKKKRNIPIPKDLVQQYYNNLLDQNIIKRVVAEGRNEGGYFRLDTELIKMKQAIDVETTATNEVISECFFERIKTLLYSERGI